MALVLAVAAASAVGGLARYGISNAFHGDALPWATVAINVFGSFLLGALVVVPHDWLSEESRTAIGGGLLGGFTTFSTFSYETYQLLVGGSWFGACANILASVGISLIGVVLGVGLARIIA